MGFIKHVACSSSPVSDAEFKSRIAKRKGSVVDAYSRSCASSEQRHYAELDNQPLPNAAQWTGGLDLRIDDLRNAVWSELSKGASLYLYVVATADIQGGRFRQRGSGPNYQGGRITLCTCKQQMRAFEAVRGAAGRGVWVAGFSRANQGPYSGNWLFYLTKAMPVPSQADVWRTLPDATCEAKAADRNKFGDLYRPRSLKLRGNHRFDPRNYAPPRSDHVHAGSRWMEDIDYGRYPQPAFLVGDPNLSFIWSRPRLQLSGSERSSLGRGQRRTDLRSLLRGLQEDGR